jgi:hypothetical protein
MQSTLSDTAAACMQHSGIHLRQCNSNLLLSYSLHALDRSNAATACVQFADNQP